MRTMSAIHQPPIRPVPTGAWQLPTSATPGAAAAQAASRAAWRQSQPLIVAVVLRLLPGVAKLAAWAWVTGYAFLGRRQAVMALMLLWLCNNFTHAIGYPPNGAAFFRHATVFASAISVFILYASAPPRSRTPGLLVWTAVMSLMLILHSMFFSTAKDISILKAISYGLSIQTLITAWSRLSSAERAVTESQMIGLLYTIALFSVPLVVLPAGYIRNRVGFQGVLEHPQSFGQVMGILAVWLTTTWLTDRNMRLSLKIAIPLLLVDCYLSRSRMAVLLYLVGVGVAIATGPLSAALSRFNRGPRLLKGRLGVVLAGGLLVAALGGSLFSELVQDFIRKGTASQTTAEAAWQARGGMIEFMQQNIRERPLTGIGLGVPSSPEAMAYLIRDPIFGLPVMATVEKGVLPVAMVEEMGWPLAVLYAPWFLALLLSAVRAGPRYAGVCAAALTLNASEAVFFSPGGGGLLIQILVTMAATAQPTRQDQTPVSRAAIVS